MPLSITIQTEGSALTTGDGRSERQQIDDAMAALGFIRDGYRVIEKTDNPGPALPPKEPFEGETAADPILMSATETATAVEPKRRGRKPKAETVAAEPEPQIRTDPENRIDPESPETVAQDAADEAAEVEAARDPVKPLTVDDVRQVVGEYVKRYGMPATQEDGNKVFKGVLGEPPAGEVIWKMSMLPDDQETLGKVVAAMKTALESNQFGRKPV
jgi:hypothetical protein